MSDNLACKIFYENSYESSGFKAQRRYPNEELMRFIGRTYASIPMSDRKEIRILEVGCGSGGNLWSLAREGFDAYGIDLSAAGIDICHEMLASWGVMATLHVGDMSNLPYESGYFDAVVDVFSSYCLPEKDFMRYLNEIERVLKPGGKYFSYTPSKNSDVFKNAPASEKIDASTLTGIHRETAPFYGNSYPFRFTSVAEYKNSIAKVSGGSLFARYCETSGRTYNHGKEYFEFVVIEADKKV
jgi:SAM-dependent methyltransferase